MLKKFLKLCDDYLKITYVKVYSPFLLEAKQQERLQKALEKYYGTKILIQNYVDPKLIGGMTCRDCGCFVQFRARHLTAACINGKW